jgi:hypothetical protein
MSNSEKKRRSPAERIDIPGGPRDAELNAGPPPSATSHRKPALPADDKLTLPRGALVAMRKSGGFRFSSRTIVVYRDGRAIYEISTPAAEAPGLWRLTDEQLVELYGALEQANFPRLPAATGRHNPDAFAYEIVARVRRRLYAAEVFDGSIPPSLAPLIRQLGQLMQP